MNNEKTTDLCIQPPLSNAEIAADAGYSILTYSSLTKFRNCRRKYKHDVIDLLSSAEKSEALWIGSIFHNAVEAFYNHLLAGGFADQFDFAVWLLQNCDLNLSEEKMQTYLLLLSMLEGYVATWTKSDDDGFGQIADDQLEYLYLEPQFIHKIRNPETNSPSRSFLMAGAVDGVVRLRGTNNIFIKEMKTAAMVDGSYLDRLWADFQSMLYARYLSDILPECVSGECKIVGVIYDITEKSRIARKQGETQEKFEERLAGYKTQKTIDKHTEAGPKPAEDWNHFHERMKAQYADGSKFHRSIIYFSEDQLAQIDSEVWEATQQLLDAKRRDKWSMNSSQCYAFNRPCLFVELCKQDGHMDDILSSRFEAKIPFRELDFNRFDFNFKGEGFFAESKKVVDVQTDVCNDPDPAPGNIGDDLPF